MIEKKDISETVAVVSSTVSLILLLALFFVSVECTRFQSYIAAERNVREEIKEATE